MEDLEAETWWREPTADFIAYIEQERNVVELSRASIEALAAQDPYSTEIEAAAASLSRSVTGPELVSSARAQSSEDHPLLHGHSLVAIWGAMETMVIDAVVAWLQHRSEALKHPKIAEMKVPFGIFQGLNREERMDYLAYELDRQRGAKAGISRFESLLEPVGLSGLYDGVLARNIYEMQQLRNVFAHKRGEADLRFVTECEQLGYRVGDRVIIDRVAWSDFTVTAILYAEVILRRMREKLGLRLDDQATAPTPIRYAHLAST